MVKAIKWFGALTMIGASSVAAVPAWALTCWTPSMLAPIDYVSAGISLTSYLDCFGQNNLHAEAQASRGHSGIPKVINVHVYSGDLARVWGYDSNRNFIPGCFIEKQGVGPGPGKTCTSVVSFLQLEAWDN